MQEKVEETTSEKKSSSTTTYFILAIVVLLIGGSAVWAIKNLNKTPEPPVQVIGTETQKPQGPPSIKGQKFSDTNFFDQAVQIYPGVVSESAKAVMNGWTLKTKTLTDGSIQADLIPVGSEATEGDTAHTFILKAGDTLYFVDTNPNDDGPTEDANTRDDMGIVVGADGIVQ